jgi:uncharacterized protein
LGNPLIHGWEYAFNVQVPANHWQCTYLDDLESFALSTVQVSPGFEFQDWELATVDKLAAKFPQHERLLLQYGNKQAETINSTFQQT